MSPQRRSGLAVTAAVLLSSLILALLVHGMYSRFRAVVIEQTRAQLQYSAASASREVDEYIGDHTRHLRALLANPSVQEELSGEGADRPVLSLLLGDLFRGHSETVAELAVYDADLRPIQRLPRGWADTDAPGPLVSAALRQRRPVVADQLSWKQGAVHAEIAVPILAQTGSAPIGAARLLLRLEPVLRTGVATIAAFGEGYAWALARDGTVVWHPAAAKRGKPMLTQLKHVGSPTELESLRSIMLDMRAGKAGSGIYETSASGGLKIAGYAPVERLRGGLSIAVGLDYEQIAEPVRLYARRVIGLGIVLLMLMGLGATFYLRGARYSRRLRRGLLAQLHHMLAVSPAAVYHLKYGRDGEALPRFISASLPAKFGYEMDDWRRGPQWWGECIHPDDLASTRRAWTTLENEGQIEHSFRFRHSAGHYLWVRDVARLLRGPDGRISELVGSWQDVTDGRHTEDRLRLAEQLFEHAAEGAFVIDERQCLLRVNPAYAQLTGYEAKQLIGAPCPALRPEYQEFDFAAVVEASLRETGRWTGEIRIRHKSGEFFPARMSISRVQDERTRVSHQVGLIWDLSTRRALERTVQRLSHYDAVSGLPNRVLLTEQLGQTLAEAARRAERLAVLFLDIDRFKQINESLGRAVGDQILKSVAGRLQSGLPAEAVLGQAGGDQFVVSLPALVSVEQAGFVAAEASRLIGARLQLDDLQFDLSCCIGISIYPDDAASAEQLLHSAEAAMYHGKGTGGGSYHFFTDDLNDRAVRRLKLVQSLRHAVARGELKLAFQGQSDLASCRIVGAEALLRWESPEFGTVSPVEFVPLAEESGLIVGIGEWAMREACRQAASWQAHGPVRVGVNLSLRQFQTGALRETVARVLAETGLDPALLELEITESLAMADPVGTTATLDGLRELGVRLALDDFGTGYSSLAYLQRLPLDTLKIDRAFIEHLDTRPDDVVLTSTIISMAHALGLSVIAEGVETARQLEILRTHGCDEIQGYFLSRPLFRDDFGRWLQAHQAKAHRDSAEKPPNPVI